jgi:hypothetical protein
MKGGNFHSLLKLVLCVEEWWALCFGLLTRAEMTPGTLMDIIRKWPPELILKVYRTNILPFQESNLELHVVMPVV